MHRDRKRTSQRETAGTPFVAGATLNVYNAGTLALLHECGAGRWVAPAELSSTMLSGLVASAPPGVETEVLVHGRLPLAWSARCFTARHYNLQKDQCDYRCLAHPDGLALDTREGQPFFNINGVQTQSAGTYNLLAEVPELSRMGVAVLRVSPQVEGTLALLELFRAVIDGALAVPAALARLGPLAGSAPCNGFGAAFVALLYIVVRLADALHVEVIPGQFAGEFDIAPAFTDRQADLVVWKEDLLTLTWQRLWNTTVAMTIVGGEVVYQA